MGSICLGRLLGIFIDGGFLALHVQFVSAIALRSEFDFDSLD